ncbi:transcriptional regulator with XRE-family HTH domain [Rhizobium aethiopicum]|uniref:helix-turn-helix domain-containing protein n=1 Tax=Rhizobium aethiopicum TaxID=1138170 RepID=UPI00161CA5B3|nr:XRE family transcriptional regulator [Rhizobium aethiopicum]MBB4581606.1 transcriptional regulator with XRE-family HTH domain [Rhizobium aethiopicum]
MASNPNKSDAATAPPPVGATIQAIRTRQKLSLDALSKRAGVSKSMLSQIERNLTNPTVAILWKLANALNVGVVEVLALKEMEPASPSIDFVPAHSTPVIKNAEGTCELRILGPVDLAGKFEWYELTIQPGGILASDPHEKGSKEHLTVLSGQLVVKADATEQKIKQGDTARYPVDIRHSIANPGKTTATALMVIEYSF